MRDNFQIIRIWRYCDGLLLLLLFALLGWGLLRGPETDSRSEKSPVKRRDPALEEERRSLALPVKTGKREPVINGIRVGTGPDLMRQIAQSLSSEWEGVPASPAMDMRKRGKSYVVALSLPGGVDRDSVEVRAVGHHLSVSMSFSGGRGQLQRKIRIPCPIDKDQVSTLMTNGVLRVLIRQ